jgi:hypothetical protein
MPLHFILALVFYYRSYIYIHAYIIQNWLKFGNIDLGWSLSILFFFLLIGWVVNSITNGVYWICWSMVLARLHISGCRCLLVRKRSCFDSKQRHHRPLQRESGMLSLENREPWPLALPFWSRWVHGITKAFPRIYYSISISLPQGFGGWQRVCGE